MSAPGDRRRAFDHLPAERPAQAEHPEAERRLRRALVILRGEGIDVHGQVAHPDPYTAAMQAVHDEHVDEIIVSTFRGPTARHGCGRTSSSGCTTTRSSPSSTSFSRRPGSIVTVHAGAHYHGPPVANQSSGSTRRRSGCSSSSRRRSCSSARSSRSTSSIGRHRPRRVASATRSTAGLRGGREHGHPRDVELHDPLGAAGDQAWEPGRDESRAGPDDRPRAHLPPDAGSPSTRGSGFARATALSARRSSA